MKPVSALALFVSLGCLVGSLPAEDIQVSDFTFEVKEPWVSQRPGSAMRAAELRFDIEGDDDPVAIFFTFGAGQGGDAQANIDRWKGMFEGGEPAEERMDLGGGVIILVLSGTYLESSGGPFAPGPKTAKADHRMLAAILPSERGAVYIRMTAPNAVADSARGAFEALVKSALD